MKEKMNVIGTNGYYFNKTNKRLEYFEIKSIKVNFHHETIVYNGLLGGKEESIVDNDLKLYETTAKYERNEPNDAWMWLGSFNDMFQKVYKFKPLRDADLVAQAWRMKAGEPVLCDILPITFNVKRTLYGAEVAADSEFDYYQSKQETLEYNDYYVLGDDGTTICHQCTASKVALSKEQKALIEKFKNILTEMQDANIAIIRDDETWDLHALSLDNIDRLDMTDDYTDDYKEITKRMTEHIGMPHIRSWYYDYGAHAKFKK